MKALSNPQEDMNILIPLHAYGVHSALGVELRNLIAKEMNAGLTVFDILGGASLEAVGMPVAEIVSGITLLRN